MESRQCKQCGKVWPGRLVKRAFRIGGGNGPNALNALSALLRRNRICKPCEKTAADKRKQRDRCPKKADDTIRRHADRLNIDKNDLIHVYGWDPKLLAHDIEFQYRNGCSYCDEPYCEMGHGLSDITLDIQDPERPPYYRTNTKWCCQTCNRKKHKMTPDEWEEELEVWRLWKAHQRLAAADRGMLFVV